MASIRDEEGLVDLSDVETRMLQKAVSLIDVKTLKDFNALQVAVLFNQLPVVKFFVEELRTSVQLGLTSGKVKMSPLVFAIKVGIALQDLSIFKYLFENHGYLLDHHCLSDVISQIVRTNKYSLLKEIMESNSVKNLYLTLPLGFRIEFLREIYQMTKEASFTPRFSDTAAEPSCHESFKEAIVSQPYAFAATFLLL